jgi:DNA repair exonuclease SbcCD ATPase subunit
MRLRSLSLKNFKGVSSFDLSMNGNDSTSIYGDNGTGKSTIKNAFLWLLFGKDAENRQDYEILPLDEDNNIISGVEAVVEAVIDHEGQEITLKKSMQEKWTKPHGQSEKIKTGNDFSYWINDVPKTMTEFKKMVASLCPNETIIRIITDPSFFNDDKAFPWKKRREMVIEIAGGDVTMDKVIESNPELSQLPGILGKNSIDDQRSIIRAEKTKINERLKDIPNSINERTLVINESGAVRRDKKTITSVMAVARDNRKAAAKRLDTILNGGAVAVKNKELSEVEAKIQRHDTKIAEAKQKSESARYKKKRELEQAADKIGRELDDKANALCKLQYDAKSEEAILANFDTRLAELRAAWKEINAETFEYDQKNTCPTCGQDLPEEDVADARNKALAVFNANKAQRLKSNVDTGKDYAAKKAASENIIIEFGLKINELKVEKRLLQDKHAKALEAVTNFENEEEVPAGPDTEREALVETKTAIEKEIADLQAGAEADISKAQAEIDEIDSHIEGLEKEISGLETIEKAETRIDELKKEERRLSERFAELEGHLHLIELFERTQANMVNEAVSSKFELARFKMFRENVTNDGIEPCCIATLNGIPYGAVNTAGQVNLDIDIGNAFSRHHGIEFPRFIDRAESVVQLLPTIGQQIRLVVTDKDKQLRIE